MLVWGRFWQGAIQRTDAYRIILKVPLISSPAEEEGWKEQEVTASVYSYF